MWQPYRVVEEDAKEIRYSYSTICSWWLYGTIALLLAATVFEQSLLAYPAFASIALYLLFVTIPGLKVAAAIRAAAKSSEVRITGSRWSFSNPLTFVVEKPVAEPESGDRETT